ncbi:hypothetical protein H6G33_31040, partial [Calothrix sp. FACHB-1219]|uniref:hypothetical protein n=1 Tax=unclassified Calothrix TaxID=2619626 RepID=UPI0016871629
MLLCWLKIATSGLAALVLTLSANPKNLKLFTPANIVAIALASYAGIELRKLEKYYQDKERCEDMLAALKDTQAEEQLQFLSSAAQRKRENEDA